MAQKETYVDGKNLPKTSRRDGQCHAPSCDKAYDPSEWDKPPPGWATVSIRRYGKKGARGATIIVCPDHTVTIARRQMLIPESTRRIPRAIIESPFAGDVQRNLKFVRAAMRDSLLRGEAPFASHALYTQEGVLDDGVAEQRKLGIEAGLAWSDVADVVVVYNNLGVTPGMEVGMKRHADNDKKILTRVLEGWNG